MKVLYLVIYFALFVYYLSCSPTVFSKKRYCELYQKEADCYRDLVDDGISDLYGYINDPYTLAFNIEAIFNTVLRSLFFLFLWFKTDANYEHIVIATLQVFSYIYMGGLEMLDKNYLSKKSEDIKFHRVWSLVKYVINMIYTLSGIIRIL